VIGQAANVESLCHVGLGVSIAQDLFDSKGWEKPRHPALVPEVEAAGGGFSVVSASLGYQVVSGTGQVR